MEAWTPDTLRKMGEHLVAESQKTEEHLAVAVAAALMTLDRALSDNDIEAHTTEVRLPSEEPFQGSRYRLLGPPEAPIEGWIRSADLSEIPRRGDDFVRDRAGELGAYCRATTVVVNSEWLLEATGVEEEHRDGLRSLCYLPYKGRGSIPLDPVDGVSCLRLFRVCEIIDALGQRDSIH